MISNNSLILLHIWWASRESNTAPTDYESAALTKHELEAQFCTILRRSENQPAKHDRIAWYEKEN